MNKMQRRFGIWENLFHVSRQEVHTGRTHSHIPSSSFRNIDLFVVKLFKHGKIDFGPIFGT